MANMGLEDLRVVEPTDLEEGKARAMAHGAESLLSSRSHNVSVGEAVAGCTVVVACTARPRRWRTWEVLSPTGAAELIEERRSKGQQCALLFGPEDSGLDNDDLVWATHICHIPTGHRHSSLNLSQAVMVLAWEWSRAHGTAKRRPQRRAGGKAPATVEQLHGAADQVGRVLDTINFFAGRNRDQTLTTLKQLLLRGSYSAQELRFLRGVVSKIQIHLDTPYHLQDRQDS